MIDSLVVHIKEIVAKARLQAFQEVNGILLKMYWDIGKLIVEEEQNGYKRAKYGEFKLKNLAQKLTAELGKGFDERNLRNMRAFYNAFPIWNAVRSELSWTHYRILSKIEEQHLRSFYMKEAIQNSWTTRVLQRNIDSLYVNRLLEITDNSPNSDSIKEFIKDPYIFEFLGVSHERLTEKELETALINHLQSFLMELGKGFAFVARQQHICTETSDFFIDLVFYNYILKCFVLIDLKIGKLTHQDIGQLDMYVRMYNDLRKGEDDNPTIGIILCTDKDETIVKYSVLAENERLFASKYRIYMPTEEELKQLIEKDRNWIENDI
ncbi:PDDEXK nuclease domain-containing protein [Raineya sp.]|jgi:predicted nuclease of restriction endonuclease-like (RecB) superfamily